MIDMCSFILGPAFYLQSISLLTFLNINKFTSFWLLEDQKMEYVNKKWRKYRNVDIENVINDSDTDFVLEVSIVGQWNTAVVDHKQHVLFPKNTFDITNVNSNDAVVEGESSDNEYLAKKEPVSKKVIERKKHFSNITKKKEISATN